MHAPLTDIRRADNSLSPEQEVVRDVFASFFEKEVQPSLVRDAEPEGFDGTLWAKLCGIEAPTMGVPEPRGGGAGLVELALVAEQLGRRLAPAPLIEALVSHRTSDRAGASDIFGVDAIVAPVLQPAHRAPQQLVPAGSVASGLITLAEDRLVYVPLLDQPSHEPNLACAPLARIDVASALGGATTLLEGAGAAAAFASMQDEWRLLTAAALTGLATAALEHAVAYAKDRIAFGVPIGSFQAISHPIVDVATAIEGARSLVMRAAWFTDHEPDDVGARVAMAFLHAVRTATAATRVGVHTLGGLGITVESDMQLYFRRAKGWPLVGGDPAAALDTIADDLLGPAEGN